MPSLHCNIHSVNPLYLQEWVVNEKGWRMLSLAVNRFCSNQAHYLSSLSFTMFIVPAAVAWRVSVHSSLCPGVLLELDH